MRTVHVYQVVREWVVEIEDDDGAVSDADLQGFAIHLVKGDDRMYRSMEQNQPMLIKHRPVRARAVPDCQMVVTWGVP